MLSATAAKTKMNLRLAGVSATTFGLIVGVTPSTMRSALAGSMYLGATTEAEYCEISARVLRLVEALKPLRCDDADTLRVMLGKDFEHIRALVSEITKDIQ